MNKAPKLLSARGIWKFLIYNGAAIGILMGFIEVCWTYFLPTFFQERRYELPISALGRYILIAVGIDALIMMAVAAFMGVVTLIVLKEPRRTHYFRHWSMLIRFSLIAIGLLYLYFGTIGRYFTFETDRLRSIIISAGILPIITISIVLVWLINILLRKLGNAGLKVVWAFAVIVLLCMTAPNYLRYRLENNVKLELPTANIGYAPNILLVTLDTLRADHVACYGNKIVKTPVLDALAADGCLFEAAFAQSPTTTPSHCTIMTSTYACRHGAMNGCAMKRGFPTLAEILRANGYDTAGFVSSLMTRSTHSGLHHGFDYYEDSLTVHTSLLRYDEFQFILAECLLLSLKNGQIPGNIVTNRALSWLDKSRVNPFFCWLHYYDPHTPYDAPTPYKDMYDNKIDVDPNFPPTSNHSRYAGEITYVDLLLGEVINRLKQKGLYEETMIIVTSDHGEAFGEKHGNIIERKHGHYLYDTTQHVPLIIKLPKAKGTGRRIKDIVQLMDLAPTVLDYLGIPSPKSFQGNSLLDLINGGQRTKSGITYAEKNSYTPPLMHTDKQALKWRNLRAMRSPEIKYICDAEGEHQELYDITSDPKETINLYRERPELAEKCYRNIQVIFNYATSSEITTPTLDPKAIKAIKSLGYIGGDEDDK